MPDQIPLEKIIEILSAEEQNNNWLWTIPNTEGDSGGIVVGQNVEPNHDLGSHYTVVKKNEDPWIVSSHETDPDDMEDKRDKIKALGYGDLPDPEEDTEAIYQKMGVETCGCEKGKYEFYSPILTALEDKNPFGPTDPNEEDNEKKKHANAEAPGEKGFNVWSKEKEEWWKNLKKKDGDEDEKAEEKEPETEEEKLEWLKNFKKRKGDKEKEIKELYNGLGDADEGFVEYGKIKVACQECNDYTTFPDHESANAYVREHLRQNGYAHHLDLTG